VRGREALARADVVLHDALAHPALLEHCKPGVVLRDVGKRAGERTGSQAAITAELVELARAGKEVVRLKGGDPLIFGRGSEEALMLREAGIEVSYVPGITAAQGVASTTGVPLTHRGLATGVRYVTGHRASDARLDLDWSSLASEETTLVVYMGSANIGEISSQLMRHGLPGTLPVLAVASATTPREFRMVSTLESVGTDMTLAALPAPVLFIIGHVVSLHECATSPLPHDICDDRMRVAVHA
jgi:uroporphyrin-III C-methyltransferase